MHSNARKKSPVKPGAATLTYQSEAYGRQYSTRIAIAPIPNSITA